MRKTRLLCQQETERDRLFHNRVRYVIVAGIVLVIVAVSVLTMVAS